MSEPLLPGAGAAPMDGPDPDPGTEPVPDAPSDGGPQPGQPPPAPAVPVPVDDPAASEGDAGTVVDTLPPEVGY
ncbi:hypothetical protein [Streptomyces sp. NPDC007100]|uniref:hypothetical protein n=1 Tax=Streptomyces sp. NPDC007100 TaxID=3155602 RepID=UPI0033F559A9